MQWVIGFREIFWLYTITGLSHLSSPFPENKITYVQKNLRTVPSLMISVFYVLLRVAKKPLGFTSWGKKEKKKLRDINHVTNKMCVAIFFTKKHRRESKDIALHPAKPKLLWARKKVTWIVLRRGRKSNERKQVEDYQSKTNVRFRRIVSMQRLLSKEQTEPFGFSKIFHET